MVKKMDAFEFEMAGAAVQNIIQHFVFQAESEDNIDRVILEIWLNKIWFFQIIKMIVEEKCKF